MRSVFAVCDSSSTLATLMGVGLFPGRCRGKAPLFRGSLPFGPALIGWLSGPAEIDRFSETDRLAWDLFYAAF